MNRSLSGSAIADPEFFRRISLNVALLCAYNGLYGFHPAVPGKEREAMSTERSLPEHDRPQDIDELIFEQESWHQVSRR